MGGVVNDITSSPPDTNVYIRKKRAHPHTEFEVHCSDEKAARRLARHLTQEGQRAVAAPPPPTPRGPATEVKPQGEPSRTRLSPGAMRRHREQWRAAQLEMSVPGVWNEPTEEEEALENEM